MGAKQVTRNSEWGHTYILTASKKTTMNEFVEELTLARFQLISDGQTICLLNILLCLSRSLASLS